jgi:hypothetical protein
MVLAHHKIGRIAGKLTVSARESTAKPGDQSKASSSHCLSTRMSLNEQCKVCNLALL